MTSSLCMTRFGRSNPCKPTAMRSAAARAILVACAIVLAGAPGCSELSATSGADGAGGGATPLKMPNTTTNAAFDAGLNALRQYFSQVQDLRLEGRLVSGWAEYDQKGGTGRLRDATLNYRNRLRRRATLWISPAEPGAVAKCQVRTQRLDTADHRAFEQQQQFNDLPNSTPIDREAATTTDQNQAWTEMQRDRQMERELLQVLSSIAAKSDTP